MILLATDTASVDLDLGAEALCVRHVSYAAPRTGPACQHVTFQEFERDPRGLAKGRRVLVIVGMNKIIGPHNRTREVFEFLHNDSRAFRKISVDHTLFVVEPWRAWFHFGFLGAPYRKYTYSYLAETHWRAAQDGLRSDDPFSADTLIKYGQGVIRSAYPRYFSSVVIDTVAMHRSVHREYTALKAACFDEEHTSAAILRRLAAFAQQAHPFRSVPTPAQLFAHRSHRIVATDLGVDRYLMSRLGSLVAITDAIGAAFYVG